MAAAQHRADELLDRYTGYSAIDLLDAMIHDEFPGQIALSSSFGADSAVLLHMVSRIEPATPILFLETGKLFGETIRYRIELAERLGLSDIRDLRPAPDSVQAHYPDGVLWRDAPDACCHIRKVVPLNQALDGFDAWINGRKRIQGGLRADIAPIEDFGGRIKVNPLAHWDLRDIAAYFDATTCPGTRLTPTDTARSAACPAPPARKPVRTSAMAAGRETTRPSAAFTFRPSESKRRLIASLNPSAGIRQGGLYFPPSWPDISIPITATKPAWRSRPP
jgi:phosphoadenosine phosphosulfate reductase